MGRVEPAPSHRVDGIPGSFLCPFSARLRFHRNKRLEASVFGQNDLCGHRIYIADTVDCLELRVFTSRDPTPERLWRISASVVNQQGISPRYPTWDELKCARYRLIPRDVHMAYILPAATSGAIYVDELPTCLQLVQIPAEAAL